mmetsp:Transcript_9080/g.18379  ORF Transcript_9080/g.18379 Transcript_9080/m.18379 type:complete len:110 (-) Transcript_9080:474-803(-)
MDIKKESMGHLEQHNDEDDSRQQGSPQQEPRETTQLQPLSRNQNLDQEIVDNRGQKIPRKPWSYCMWRSEFEWKDGRLRNSAPLEKNPAQFLNCHPDCVVYDGNDKKRM